VPPHAAARPTNSDASTQAEHDRLRESAQATAVVADADSVKISVVKADSQDLERPVLGEEARGDEDRAAQDGEANLAERHPEEAGDEPDPEAPRHFSGRVRGAQRGGDGQVDRRVGERHDDARTEEARRGLHGRTRSEATTKSA